MTESKDSIVFLFNPNIGKEVLSLSKDIVDEERAIIVDTNYLTQVNRDDLLTMSLNPDYENEIKTKYKKQMARLFRNFMQQKITLCFSNFIMREFIGCLPKREDLLDLYLRNIVVISPKKNLETCFLDLSAAINCHVINETGEQADLKDTFSYLLAALAGVKFFVTEDKDLRRVYRYFTAMYKKTLELRHKEVQKIMQVYGRLSKEDDFPVKAILDYLFFGDVDVLPIPISLSKLESSLPLVLDKFETILLIFDSLQEINWLIESLSELPDDFDGDIIEMGNHRIFEVASSVGFNKTDPIDKCSLKVKLIEEEAIWSEESYDKQIAEELTTELTKLHVMLYEQDVEPEYSTMEEQFAAEEPSKQFDVKCNECGENIPMEANYNGVVLVEQRNMGPEFYHEWTTEEHCPKCNNPIKITHELWEYPQFWFNGEDTECEGGTLVPKEKMPAEKPSLTLLDFS